MAENGDNLWFDQVSSPKSEKASTVYLIDDHPVMIQGISLLIDAEPDLAVCGQASSWTIAFKEIPKVKPDLVILDITLGVLSGVEVLKDIKIHFPTQRVLMLSMHEENLYAARTLKAGAHGYLSKDCATEQLVPAIRQILQGEVYLSSVLSRKMMSRLMGRESVSRSPLEALSDRELQIYVLVGDGLTTRQIGERLHLSVKTIETHKAHVKKKLILDTANELMQHAIEHGQAPR